MSLKMLVSKAMFKFSRIGHLAPARKPNRKGLLFTHEKSDFGAISMTERSCAAQISKLKRYISDRFCATLEV